MAQKTQVLSRKQRIAARGAKYGARAIAIRERVRGSLSRRRPKEEPPPWRPTRRDLVLVTATGTSIGGVYLIRKRISGRKDKAAIHGADARTSVDADPAPGSTGNGGPTHDLATSGAADRSPSG